MQIAINGQGKRVSATEAKRENEYYCPICNSELVYKVGTIKIAHFAHKNTVKCDSWHYDMTEWHYKWQLQFPADNREIIFEKNGRKHRADVFINNTVIEFQHSDISYLEFCERNEFYNSLGYDVEWIFDVRDCDIRFVDYKLGSSNEIYSWHYPKQLLQNFDYKNKHVRVFLQIGESIWDKKQITSQLNILMIY